VYVNEVGLARYKRNWRKGGWGRKKKGRRIKKNVIIITIKALYKRHFLCTINNTQGQNMLI